MSSIGCHSDSYEYIPALERIGDTLVDLNRCNHPELFEYMRKFNRVIPREYLQILGMVVEEDNDPKADPRIDEMTAHFVENCLPGYSIHRVIPYMSTHYPYCRWLVNYIANKDRDYRNESPRVEFYLLCISKPRHVYPILHPDNYRDVSIFSDKWIQYGVKECSCPRPTRPFSYQFNAKHEALPIAALL